MNKKVWLINVLVVAAAAGCQQAPSFTQQHPRAALLTQGIYPPPAVQAGASQNVYVYDDSSDRVVLQTATTQPTTIDLRDAAAFGGSRVLFNVNLSHHYSIYSESNATQAVSPAPTPVPSPAQTTPVPPVVPTVSAPVVSQPAATKMPAPVVSKPTTKPVDPQIEATKVYNRGVDEWNSQKWDTARADFIQAKTLGYRTGFGERSPEDFVKRIDKKIAEAKAAKQQAGASKLATQPSTRPAK